MKPDVGENLRLGKVASSTRCIRKRAAEKAIITRGKACSGRRERVLRYDQRLAAANAMTAAVIWAVAPNGAESKATITPPAVIRHHGVALINDVHRFAWSNC